MVTAKGERDDVARYMLLKGMAFEGTKEKSVLEMAKSRELPPPLSPGSEGHKCENQKKNMAIIYKGVQRTHVLRGQPGC